MQWYPVADGFLPKWLYFVSLVSLANSFQAYSTLAYTREIYKRSPASVTALSGRTFGTWTALSAVIRLYAALNINDTIIYQLALATYAIAWLHFMAEWQIYGTAAWGKGLAGPVFVSTGSIIWMLIQWNYYVQ